MFRVEIGIRKEGIETSIYLLEFSTKLSFLVYALASEKLALFMS